jgi:hypothetical protein
MAGLSPFYEKRPPSMQTVLDIFRGTWKSAFPAEFGLVAGDAPLFGDQRPPWVDNNLPGGLKGRTVLELGPFEGYQTYLLEKLGASSITSIEANSINYLKCLVVKNVLGLSANYLFGDFVGYLENTPKHYDLCWASGVLYHQVKPLRFLELISQRASAIFIWTHYYDTEMIKLADPGQQSLFISAGNKIDGVGDFKCSHYLHTYNIGDYDKAIPLHWEGGLVDHSYWLEYDDIIRFLKYQNFSFIKSDHFGAVWGLPCVSILASK